MAKSNAKTFASQELSGLRIILDVQNGTIRYTYNGQAITAERVQQIARQANAHTQGIPGAEISKSARMDQNGTYYLDPGEMAQHDIHGNLTNGRSWRDTY